MKLTRTLRNYTKWFRIFGQSCYPPFYGELTTSGPYRYVHKMLNYLPSVVIVIADFALAIGCCVYLAVHYYSGGEVGFTLITTNAISTMIAILVTVVQSVSHLSSYALLFTQIDDIERTANEEYVFDYQAFRSSVFRYFIIIGGAGSLPLAAVLISKLKFWANYTFPVLWVMLRILSLMSIVQCVFYLNLYNFLLKSFVEYVEVRGRSTSWSRAVDFVANEFFHYKLLHFKLCAMRKTIKKMFGWSLTVLLLQNFSLGLFCVFYMILTLDSHGLSREMFRKWSSV